MNLPEKGVWFILIFSLFTLIFQHPSTNLCSNDHFTFQSVALAADEPPDDVEPFDRERVVVADPFEGLNRAFFTFNDKLYFWLLKPVSKAYGTVIPPGLRIAVRSAFDNLSMPIRAVNCGLQGKGDAMGIELARFVINSTLGVGGLIDFAGREYQLYPHDEDTGQTLGFYGMKPAMYIYMPLLGPSSLRDSLGLVGDYFLNPITYLTADLDYSDYYVSGAIRAGKMVNNTSLVLGDYEDFKRSALDPYISMRDAYLQYRAEQIKN